MADSLRCFSVTAAEKGDYDREMATTVFGIGAGLVILISIWIVAISIGLVSLRTNRNTGAVAILAAGIITVTLLLIPLDSKTPTPPVFKVYDDVFIWRSSLLILLTISTIAGSVSYLVTHLMEPRFAQPIKEKRS